MPANYVLMRQLAGLMFLIDLFAYLPWANVCLGAGYWGRGHGRALPLVLLVWAAGALSLVLGIYPLIGAAALWILFRHFYVANRWKNLFRGGGAPGFMSHWTAMFLSFFETAAFLDGSGRLSHDVFRLFNVDLAVILLCSGSYKSLSGYLHGEGMEYGMANPMWSYWFNRLRRVRPSHPLLRAQNAWAPTAQILTGILMLIPATRPWGALLCMASFLYLLPIIRLGRLAVLMTIVPIVLLPNLHFALPAVARGFAPVAAPAPLLTALRVAIYGYIVLLPLVKVTQYLNLFARLKLPGPLQAFLTGYANRVPIIMWRVFSPDVTNFFVRIFRVADDGAETPLLHEDGTYSYRQLGRFAWSARFLHVTESIAITTVFTTAKYFRSQRALFEEKLVQYARTLARGGRIKFQLVAIVKGERAFEYLPVSNFTVDLAAATVAEERLADYAYDAPARHSHIKETTGYGSYLPKGDQA
jgi:hypothetical protein